MMESIHFTLPTYWEVLHFLSELDVKFVVSVIVSFCLGFLVRRFLDGRLMKEMTYQIEDLRMRLRGAMNLVAARRRSIDEIPVSFEEAPRESISQPTIKDIDMAKSQHTEGGMKPTDSREMHPKAMRRIVLITKVLGAEEVGISLQTPLLGYEKAPPVVSQPYQVELEGGRLLTTSVVNKISDEYVHTHNSLYKVEALEALFEQGDD